MSAYAFDPELEELDDVCGELGCSKPYFSKGWCERHYHMRRRAGLLVIRPTPPAPPERRPGPRKVFRSAGMNSAGEFLYGCDVCGDRMRDPFTHRCQGARS